MTGSNAEQTISQEKYVSVATFRKTGVAVATATWIVPLDGGRVGLLTSSASGKAKRLRNNPSVTLQPSDVRGRVKAGTTPVTGTVELVTSGPDFEAITSRVKAKYGLMVPITRLAGQCATPGQGPLSLCGHRRGDHAPGLIPAATVAAISGRHLARPAGQGVAGGCPARPGSRPAPPGSSRGGQGPRWSPRRTRTRRGRLPLRHRTHRHLHPYRGPGETVGGQAASITGLA